MTDLFSADAILLWRIALLVLFVVTVVVGVLVTLVIATAGAIETDLKHGVWPAGTRVAANTVHLGELAAIRKRLEEVVAIAHGAEPAEKAAPQ